MKKRKLDLKSMAKDIYNRGIVRVSKEEDEYFFEIGKELTSDVAEAVAILMRKVDFNEAIWDLEVSNIILENITPERSLFWLTGGYSEWRTLENYNKLFKDNENNTQKQKASVESRKPIDVNVNTTKKLIENRVNTVSNYTTKKSSPTFESRPI